MSQKSSRDTKAPDHLEVSLGLPRVLCALHLTVHHPAVLPLPSHVVHLDQRYIEITHDHLLFRRNILTVLTETLTQYITFNIGGERGVSTIVFCSLATVLSCIGPSVRIVTKSPKVGPLLIFSISLT
jgi:hypothetical protein